LALLALSIVSIGLPGVDLADDNARKHPTPSPSEAGRPTARPAGAELFGFVVHRSDANLDAENDAACLSHLDKLRLRLHYAIL
jgi:hypothetical protein